MEKQLNVARLKRENEQLRDALDALLSEVEASNVKIDTTPARDSIPAPKAEREPIEPPWKRQGYDSKADWMAEK